MAACQKRFEATPEDLAELEEWATYLWNSLVTTEVYTNSRVTGEESAQLPHYYTGFINEEYDDCVAGLADIPTFSA